MQGRFANRGRGSDPSRAVVGESWQVKADNTQMRHRWTPLLWYQPSQPAQDINHVGWFDRLGRGYPSPHVPNIGTAGMSLVVLLRLEDRMACAAGVRVSRQFSRQATGALVGLKK